MFFRRPVLSVQPASTGDREALLALAQRAYRIHAHLDWQPAEDWLGAQPFLLVKEDSRLVGALACPPDPPDTAWIRLLTLGTHSLSAAIWEHCWPQARKQLEDMGVTSAAALSLANWIDAYCRQAGFVKTHEVVVLSRTGYALPELVPSPARVRAARPDDQAAIIALDTAAFVPPWQHSPALLEKALQRADYTTVAEIDGRVVGYQLTTPGVHGAHLARLAVLPEWQGRGVGAALVAEMLTDQVQKDVPEVTVNTQSSNAASLRLYQRMGFALNGARFPVYQLTLA